MWVRNRFRRLKNSYRRLKENQSQNDHLLWQMKMLEMFQSYQAKVHIHCSQTIVLPVIGTVDVEISLIERPITMLHNV